MGEMGERMVGGEEVMGKRRRMGKTSNSIKIAAVLLFSVATVAGKPILMMVTLCDTDHYDWIFGWLDKIFHF